ncbi:MAG: phenylacetate--CoA ligase family protein [Pirellulaceae bacterium]
MNPTTFADRRAFESLDRTDLVDRQLIRLNQMLEIAQSGKGVNAERLANVRLPLDWQQFQQLPFTFKSDLITNDDTWAANRTFELDRYVRFHRTSGTHGKPLVVVDTPEDWQWWIDTWQFVLDAAEVTDKDRAFMAFSFGPFIGFWSANDALVRRGALVIPGGGLDTQTRLDLIFSSSATVVLCTPTYAMRMAEVAAEHQMDLKTSQVQKIIVAGEPGGSIPEVRDRIEQAWGATVIDHSGATEIGPWGYMDPQRRGLRIVESEFVAEFVSVDRNAPAAEGELSELILTSLGRHGCPVIRYRTGDLVRPVWSNLEDNHFVLLEGGVIGRADDMVIIRGVNVFPSSLERIIRQFDEVTEFRIVAFRDRQMDALRIEVECADEATCATVQSALKTGLGLRMDVARVDSLPRFEAKGRRFVDQR